MDFSQLLLPLWPRFDVKHAAQLALDQEVYGLFPEFIPLLRRTPLNDAIARIQEINSGELRALLEEIPDSWGADAESRKSTVEFLLARAEFLTETLVNRLESMATVLGREGNNRNEDAE